MTREERYEILKKHYYDILVIDFDDPDDQGDFIAAWQETIDELGELLGKSDKVKILKRMTSNRVTYDIDYLLSHLANEIYLLKSYVEWRDKQKEGESE